MQKIVASFFIIHYNVIRTDKGSTALNCAFNVWASDFYTPVEII